MKQKIKTNLILTLAFVVFLSVPAFFIVGFPGVEQFITKTLGIRINPALSGGEVMAVFNDEYFDDKGPGTYTYPNAEAYQPYGKHLDLLKYIIKKPVHNASWSEFKEFWVVELVMGDIANPLNAPAGFSFPVINIYINVDGKEGGRTDTLFPGANVSFDSKHPWHYFISFNGWEKDGKLFNYKNEYIDKVLIDIIKKEDKLRITIPIEKSSELKTLSEKSITYHYVIVGNYDSVETGNFRSISDKESRTFGGGSKNPAIAPKVYDYLAPADANQYKMLSGYDPIKGKFAILKPVKVVLGTGLNIKEPAKLLTKKDEFNFETKRKKDIQTSIIRLEEIQRKISGSEEITIQLVALYFQIGDYAKAEILIKKQNNPAPAILAYLGAINAKKAADAKSIFTKMELVSNGIKMLDKAASDLKENTTDMIHVLMCRGTVYTAIPESFRKLDTGIKDLEKLTMLLEDKGIIDLQINVAILLGDSYAKKRLFKQSLDQYYNSIKIVQSEYHTKKLKDKIAETESFYLEKMLSNL